MKYNYDKCGKNLEWELCKQLPLSTEVMVSIQLQLQGLKASRDSTTCSGTLQKRRTFAYGGHTVEGQEHSPLPPTYLLCNELSAKYTEVAPGQDRDACRDKLSDKINASKISCFSVMKHRPRHTRHCRWLSLLSFMLYALR